MDEFEEANEYGADPMLPQEQPKVMSREEPETNEIRRQLVKQLCAEVRADKKHWAGAFKQMREDRDFAYGMQWPDEAGPDNYVANIVLRHIRQRVSALYAKNPRAVARRRPRLDETVWDGTLGQVEAALQQAQMALMGGDIQGAMSASAVLQDAQASVERKKQLDKFARTLELLYEYNIDEQAHPFKAMMKLVVLRAVTTGVGYVKLGFQRVLQPRPDIEARIADATQQLATLERLSADMADGEMDDIDGEKEQLRLLLQALSQQQEVVVREGIVFDYPDSTSIIPDRKTRQLSEFLGADRVTQEYVLTPDEIKEIYKVDVGNQHTKYRPGTNDDPLVSAIVEVTDDDMTSVSDEDNDKPNFSLVWEIYSRKDGLVYTICDGYPEFLVEPAPPEVWTERFWPWFALVMNEVDHPKKIYPPSDVHLLRHQQKEYNRLRQSLREHRIANRPKMAAAGGMLSAEDVEKLVHHPANAVLELDGLQPGQSVEQLLQAIKMPGVDPNLYESNSIFEDVLRTVGVQEATLGGSTAGSTATETSIAEGSRMSSLQSCIDDLDDMLSQLARNAGQILLAETSEQLVKETLGPGAVWPEMTREDLAKEVYLEIEAGSTGRPNQAQEIQNYERLMPLLIQLPGLSPEMLAREGIRRLDDRLDLSEVYDPNQLSIAAMNQLAGAAPGGVQQNAGPNAPADQAGAGAQNAPVPGRPEGSGVPVMSPGQPGMPLI